MIDLHAHILPGFDDGPATLDDSLNMARAYVQAGYTAVVATPHVIPGIYEHTRGEILVGLQELQAAVKAEGIPLEILPGAEYFLTPDLPGLLKEGELLTINDNGRYLLVELPQQEVPPYTQQVLFELLLAGVKPVLVHPERNDFFASHPEAFAETVRKGILAQVTAGCLIGLFGFTARRTANFLIKEGLAQFIATDAHGPGRRMEAGPQAAVLLGEKSRLLMRDNPSAVICGTTLDAAARSDRSMRHSSWLSGLFGRMKNR